MSFYCGLSNTKTSVISNEKHWQWPRQPYRSSLSRIYYVENCQKSFTYHNTSIEQHRPPPTEHCTKHT